MGNASKTVDMLWIALRGRPLNLRTLFAAVAILAGTLCILPGQSMAIDFDGTARPAAMDQPQINMIVRTDPNAAPVIGDPETIDLGGGIIVTVAPAGINIQAYLDTGSSGTLMSDVTAQRFHIATPTGPGGQEVLYYDVGIGSADAVPFHVSQPLYIGFASYTPNINTATGVETVSNYTQQVGPTRLQVGPLVKIDDTFASLELAFGLQDLNVVGMPLLAGKVMVMDNRHLNGAAALLAPAQSFDDVVNIASTIPDSELTMRTYLYKPTEHFHAVTVDSDPGIPATGFHVKLSKVDFAPFTSITPAGATGPSLNSNPFIGPNPLASIPGNPFNLAADNTPGVKISFTNPFTNISSTTSGSFLLDTGAAASFISQSMAQNLGIHYLAGTPADSPQLVFADGSVVPNQFQLAISGTSGQITAAGFYLGSLLIHTMEGSATNDNDPRNLRFLGAPVLVTDISVSKPDPVHPGQTINVTLDGDLGINFLTAGYVASATDLTDIGGFSPSPFNWAVYNDKLGVLGLDVASAPILAGDFNHDGLLTVADISLMMQALAGEDQYEIAHGLTDSDLMAIGDVNGDHVFNNLDIQELISDAANGAAGGSAVPTAVPEPASGVLLGIGLMAMAVAARRKRRG